MPRLPYCVVLTKALVKPPAIGVLDANVQSADIDELTVLSSELGMSQITPQTFQQSALEFHRVVHAAFAEAAVIPFRFPTWLSADELANHVQKESTTYRSFLTKHADHVQMELRIAQASVVSPPDATGTQHLRRRAAQFHEIDNAAQELKHLLAAEALEWRERDIPEGKRLYALVERRAIAAFRERLSGRGLQVSGPWPATEFLE